MNNYISNDYCFVAKLYDNKMTLSAPILVYRVLKSSNPFLENETGQNHELLNLSTLSKSK